MTPLLCLHGWGMRGAIFADLALPGRAVLMPDLPGYGDAPLPTTVYSAEAIARQLAAHAPARLALLGWSMGSLVAQAWARLFPEQVERLVLVSATPCFRQRADWPHGLSDADIAAFSEGVTQDSRATLARFLSLQARGSEDARAVIARLRMALAALGEPSATTLAAGMALLADTDLRVDASAIRAPTLMLHGDRDGLCPPVAAAWLAGQIPEARQVVLARAAHAPFLSHPAVFRRTVMEFLDE
jgi:pimeloyl-[acyl-carrier protein] methyl ester esterase